ncbi:MAG: hypothetical protein KBD83_00710, partial [Gammaproteobacteria bacterium]|nr:hypothetical protein [Gammaproteobacteria bacterium]
MRYDTLRKIKANLVQKLDEYEYEHTVTGGIARLAFKPDKASKKYTGIRNRCVAKIVVADSPEAVVAALMNMAAELQELDKNTPIPFGYFENYAAQALQQFTSRETDPYFYLLLGESGLNTYFGHPTNLKNLQPGKQHNGTFRQSLCFNAEVVSQFFSAFDDKTLSSLPEEQRSQYVLPILTAKTKEDFKNAIVNLVLAVLRSESDKWLPSSSNIDTFSKTLNQALILMSSPEGLGVDFKQSLMQTMLAKDNDISPDKKSKKLEAFFQQVTSVLHPNTPITTASSAPEPSLSFYARLHQTWRGSATLTQTTSESILPADPYQIRLLPPETASAIESAVSANPNDIITLYNISRNNLFGFEANLEQLQIAAQDMRAAPSSEVSMTEMHTTVKKVKKFDEEARANRARLYCNNLITPEFIRQTKGNVLTQELTKYLSAAVRNYKSDRTNLAYQKALAHRYKQCLAISQKYLTEFSFNYVDIDDNTLTFLENHSIQPEYTTDNAEDREALAKENLDSTSIDRVIKEKCDLIDEEYSKIDPSIRAIKNHGLAVHSAKDLANLTALYQILVLSNQAVESDDNLSQDLRLQKQFLAQACLEKIKLGMGQPVALQQHFSCAKALSFGPLADYLPACPAYPLVVVDNEPEAPEPKATYVVRGSQKLYQTDEYGGKRVFEGINIDHIVSSNSQPTTEQTTALDNALTMRGGYSISERKLPALLKGVSQIQESPEELLQFNEKTQYAELLHILPCSFSMAVYFVLQYTDPSQSTTLPNILSPEGSSLKYFLGHQFLLPESMTTLVESLFADGHSHQVEIQDLLRQLSAIFATVEQLRKLDNYNDPKILQQILILPEIVDALTKELAKQKNITETINDPKLNQLITIINEEAQRISRQFAQDLSQEYSFIDQSEEIQQYIFRHSSPEEKENYFRKSSQSILNNPKLTAQEKLVAINKLSTTLGPPLSEDFKLELVPKFFKLMRAEGEIFIPEFYTLLNSISDDDAKNNFISLLNTLIIEQRELQFDARKSFAADEMLNWMFYFGGQIRKAEVTLGHTFAVSNMALMTQYVDYYNELNVQQIINTRLSSLDDFEGKFLKLCDDLISREFLALQDSSGEFSEQKKKYVAYVYRVAEPLLQAYINWLKDETVLDHFHPKALNEQINYLLDGVVYSGCNRETFVQDQIALCINEEKFDDAEILIRHLSDDDTSAKLSSIILLLRSAALDDSQSTSLKAAGLVLCEAIATKDAAFSSLLSNAISSNHAMDAEAIKTARNLDDGALGKILITDSVMNSLIETQRETMRTSVSDARQSVAIRHDHKTTREELINTELSKIETSITQYKKGSTNKARKEMASEILNAITLLKAKNSISQNDIDPLKMIMERDAKAILKEYGNDSTYAEKGGYWGFSKGSALYRTLTQSIGDITALAQELDILAIAMDKQLIAAYVTTFSHLDFSDALQSSDYDRIASHYKDGFTSNQKNVVTQKILLAFKSLGEQLQREPVAIDFTLSNIYRLINLSAQLKQKGAEAPLLDRIKEPLSAFFVSFNIDAVIEQAFPPSATEDFDRANTLIGLQKISQALNQPEFDGLPSLTSISTTADLALESQKRKYLDRWATGQCDDASDSLFKTSLQAFGGISSQASLDDKNEDFSLILWSSLQDTTLLRHYAFKVWDCLPKDPEAINPEKMKLFEQNLVAGTLTDPDLIGVITYFSSSEAGEVVEDELEHIKSSLDLFEAHDQLDLKQQAIILLRASLADEPDYTGKKVFFLKEAFFALSKIATLNEIDDALVAEIGEILSNGQNLKALSKLLYADKSLQQAAVHLHQITRSSDLAENNPASQLSQEMNMMLEDFTKTQIIQHAVTTFSQASMQSISVLSTDAHLTSSTREDRLKQKTFEACEEQYFNALETLKKNPENCTVLAQLVTALERLQLELRNSLVNIGKPSRDFMPKLESMIAQIEQNAINYYREISAKKNFASDKAAVAAEEPAIADTPLISTPKSATVSAEDTSYIEHVCRQALDIKSETPIREMLKGYVMTYPNADRNILAAYVLCRWYRETDGGKKNFSDTKRNNLFIEQYEAMENRLLSNVCNGTKIFPSESVNQFVAAVSQQAKTLGLLKSGLTRTESSLARL